MSFMEKARVSKLVAMRSFWIMVNIKFELSLSLSLYKVTGARWGGLY